MRFLQRPKLLTVCFHRISPSLYRLISTEYELHRNEHSTIRAQEVEFYSNQASKWWDELGEYRPLHSFNKLRVPLVRDGLINKDQVGDSSQPLQGLKILDVGCGGGILCEPLARIGATVTGIDATQKMIETAKVHASQDPAISDRITYICQTVEEHANEYRNYYDAVVASEIVEHVAEKELFLSASISTLKPGGSIFLTTINRTFALWLCGIIIAEYVLRFVPKGTHDINECVKLHELQGFLEKYGCSTKLIHGTFYNSFTNKWYWSSSTQLSYAVHAVRKRE